MAFNKSFFFARHGETEHNVKGLAAGGQIDSALTETGRSQALALREKIASLPLTHVISSPLLRAKHTAEIICPEKVIVEEGLRELNLGIYEGTDDVSCTKTILSLPWQEPLPEGESKAEFQNRIMTSITKWLEEDKEVLFVGHGFVFAAILLTLKLPIYELKNCELVHVSLNDDKWTIETL